MYINSTLGSYFIVKSFLSIRCSCQWLSANDIGFILNLVFFFFFLIFMLITFLTSLSLSLSLSLSNALFGCWEMKGKKKDFFIWWVFCCRENERKEKEKVIFFLSVLETVSLPRKTEQKKRKRKNSFFPLPVALFGCWEMNFVKGNEREEQKNWFLNFLIFILKVFNKLFIYLGHNGLNERVSN